MKKGQTTNNDPISIKGNRDKWIKFTNRLREERKNIWEVLEEFIDKYLNK